MESEQDILEQTVIRQAFIKTMQDEQLIYGIFFIQTQRYKQEIMVIFSILNSKRLTI